MKKLNLKGLLDKPFVKNILAPVLRGSIQTLPFGGVAVQAMRNIKHELNEDKEGGAPHNYVSMAIQFVGLALITYAFISKQLTIEQVLSLIGFAK